ncbi:MAG: hypothetical protein DI587_17155 [Variovorax paradoxus]|nr:MAG: hypothetical protein DI583_17155 [Variovorax paradoxus]PZQ08963.1 MAG: hypothetical protein DI587_17155 [Variovorax paradoxus]
MKAAYRLAAIAKRQPPPPSKFWQRKLTPETQTTARILHWDALTSIANGTATEATMWEWIAGALTFDRMAQLLAEDGVQLTHEARAALAEQRQIAPTLRRRHAATGRVVFTGPELMAARAAAHVVDDLLTLDRHGVSTAAAEWSERQVAAMKATAIQPNPN